MRNYERLDQYLDLLKRDVYPEAETSSHDEITQKVFDLFIVPHGQIIQSALDVGCGQGVALKRFSSLGIDAVGITLSREDHDFCLNRGFRVALMDQSFLEHPGRSFDLVYARHVLEHSPFPVLTLFEFNRVLKPYGFLYVEVPQAESIHCANPNHYSMLGKRSLTQLFKRARFAYVKDLKINFALPDGTPDEYWGWWLRKEEDLAPASENPDRMKASV